MTRAQRTRIFLQLLLMTAVAFSAGLAVGYERGADQARQIAARYTR